MNRKYKMVTTWIKKWIAVLAKGKIITRPFSRNTNPSIVTEIGSIFSKPQLQVVYKKSDIGKWLLKHRSENSILDNPGELVPYEVGNRKRYATCSGVLKNEISKI